MTTTEDHGLVLAELDPHDKSIREDEGRSIESRWKFGKVLLDQKVGKQLPNGLRERVAEHFKLEASEITRRMQLARKFETREELVAACTTHGSSWRTIIAKELIKSRPSRDVAWDDRVRRVAKSIDALMQEANGSDDRHADVKALLCEKAQALGLELVEAES